MYTKNLSHPIPLEDCTAHYSYSLVYQGVVCSSNILAKVRKIQATTLPLERHDYGTTSNFSSLALETDEVALVSFLALFGVREAGKKNHK